MTRADDGDGGHLHPRDPRVVRARLIAAGTTGVAPDALGAFLPVLPTTPFQLGGRHPVVRGARPVIAVAVAAWWYRMPSRDQR